MIEPLFDGIAPLIDALSKRDDVLIGAVTGTGVFSLEPRDGGGTTVRWSEQLEFPWWFGGPPAQVLARPFLMWVWRRNLSNLARLVDAGPAV